MYTRLACKTAIIRLSTATNLFNSVVNSTILILANLLSKRVAKTSLW